MSRSSISIASSKRLLDLAIAIPLTLASLPLAAAIALAVRFRLGSPVLFRDERAGRGGRPIMVTKFRTMTEERGADDRLLADADRLTSFGRRLRSTSLDELPQLWSILTGDMSLVGPRPLPLVYVDRYSPHQARRLEATPGITGWAQIRGRNSLAWSERLDFDVWYVENQTLRLDLRILFGTAGTVFRRTGVSAEGHATMPEFLGDDVSARR